MSNLFVSPFAICPYYKGEKGLKIHCSGCPEIQTVQLSFGSTAQREQWTNKHCKQYDYDRCWIAAALNEEWEK